MFLKNNSRVSVQKQTSARSGLRVGTGKVAWKSNNLEMPSSKNHGN